MQSRTEYWSDGLLDILAGICVCLTAVAWQLDFVALAPLAPVVIMPFWKPLRERFTHPRLTSVRDTLPLSGHSRHFLLATVILGAFFLAAAITLYSTEQRGWSKAWDEFLSKYIAALPAILVGLLAFLTAIFTRQLRFVLYSLIFVFSGVVVALTGREPGWAILAGGLVLLSVGLIVLVRFVSLHPELSSKNIR